MRYVHKLFSGRHAGPPAAVLTVALGLAFACSESPTEATLDDLAPRFHHRPGHGGGPGGGEDPPDVIITTSLLGDEGTGSPGVYGDGAPYDPLRQDCSANRFITLELPTLVNGMPSELPLPAVCGEGRDSDRVQVHLPGDPFGGNGLYGDTEPSFEFKGPNKKVHPTGWMRPTLNLFWDCDGGDDFNSRYCNFVWTDGALTTNGAGTVTSVTGGCAKLYVDQTGVPMVPNLPPEETCAALHNGGPVAGLGFPLKLLVKLEEEVQ